MKILSITVLKSNGPFAWVAGTGFGVFCMLMRLGGYVLGFPWLKRSDYGEQVSDLGFNVQPDTVVCNF